MIDDRLTLALDTDCARLLAEYIRRLAVAGGLTTRQTYMLRLAADEIVTNIIQHGYKDGCGPVELTGWREPRHVLLRIEDEAPPFDPRSHDPEPVLRSGPTDRWEGGLGLYLAMHSVDEFRYEYVSVPAGVYPAEACRGRNVNTLVMRRPRPDPAWAAVPTAADGRRA